MLIFVLLIFSKTISILTFKLFNTNFIPKYGIYFAAIALINFVTIQIRMKSANKSNGLWFYGLSGSGKTYASKYLKKLINNSFIIDGDEIRKNISFDLNYTLIDRKLQVKRVLGLAKICIDQNLYPIISTVYFDKKLQKELKKVRIKLVGNNQER